MKKLFALLLATLTLAACGSPAAAPQAGAAPAQNLAQLESSLKGLSPADRQKTLVAGAVKEGAVSVYLSYNEQQSNAMAAAFQKRFPGVKATVLRAGSGDIANRVLTEGRAHKWLWDVANADGSYTGTFRQEGILAQYSSPLLSEIQNKDFYDANGWWVGGQLEPVALAWNTQKVAAGQAPKSYEDLTAPAWKGQFSLDTEDYLFYEYLLKTQGQEKGSALLKALAANKPRMVRGRTPQESLLVAGDFKASAALFDYRVVGDKQKGAPIDFTYVDPVLVSVDPLFLAAQPPHPYAALLFMDWIVSKDGQQVVADQGRTPIRNDVTFKLPALKDVFQHKVYLDTPNTENAAEFNQTIQAFNQLFGLTSGK